MKTFHKFLLVLGGLSLVPGLTRAAPSAAAPQPRDLTVWIDSPTGSLIGDGYVRTFLTNIRARTIGKEDPKLPGPARDRDELQRDQFAHPATSPSLT